MKTIATLTLNPTIDISTEVLRIEHTHKMRTAREFFSPGGGGINVSRVLHRLGIEAHSYYLCGGITGDLFESLARSHGLTGTRIPICDHTRTSTAVYETSTGKEYRFVSPGPNVERIEWEACLEAVCGAGHDLVVASGSLPPGVPDDFYAQMARRISRQGGRLVLDSSGAGLGLTLAEAPVFLVKPSLGELQALTHKKLASTQDIAMAAAEIVRAGQAECVMVTMGHQGALMAHEERVCILPSLPVEPKSAVGAGDSFLAAAVFSLAKGQTLDEAFRYGIAAGSAAVISPGAGLAEVNEIERLFKMVPEPLCISAKNGGYDF